MESLTITSVEGDTLMLSSSSKGFHLEVVPTKAPVSDEYLDIFSVGLNFSSIAKAIQCLKGGPLFTTNDKKYNLSMQQDKACMRFVIDQYPGKYFTTTLEISEYTKLLHFLETIIYGAQKVSSKKVGRNEPCPCGSGKKYKRCCLNKDSEPALPHTLEFAHSSEDPMVKSMLDYARKHPEALRDPEFWNSLGQALGSSDDHQLAMEAFSQALAIDPDNSAAKMNSAVTLSHFGNHEDAIQLVKDVPEETERKAVIIGNILQKIGHHVEAISYYEEAIKREPDFFLPYIKLLSSLKATNSPLFGYWLDRAIKSIPKSATLASLYCHHLLEEGRIPELAKAKWIDSLQSDAGRTNMLGRSADDPKLIIEAQLFRTVALIQESHSKGDLANAVTILQSTDPEWHLCAAAKLLTTTAANLGDSDSAKIAFSRICEECKKENGIQGSIDRYLAVAFRVSGDYEKAVQCCEVILECDPDDLFALGQYWWCLDELGRINEAVKAAQHLFQLSPEEPHLSYSLGFLCGKKGSYGLAQHYYEHSVQNEPLNWRAFENLAFVLLLNKEIESAENCWGNFCASIRKAALSGMDYESDFVSEGGESVSIEDHINLKIEKWTLLIEKSKRWEESPSYSLDLLEFNRSSEPYVGAAGMMIHPGGFLMREIISTLKHPETEEAIELAHKLAMQQQGDLSPLIVIMRKEFPNWKIFPKEAQNALIEGERRLQEGTSHDHAPQVVCFAKAVEIILRILFFEAYAKHLQFDFNIKKEIEIGFQDKFKQVHSFLRFLERGDYLELGSMAHVLRLCGGKTAKKLTLLGRFRIFIVKDLSYPDILDSRIINDLEALSRIRNKAAHSSSFGKSEALRAREVALKILACV